MLARGCSRPMAHRVSTMPTCSPWRPTWRAIRTTSRPRCSAGSPCPGPRAGRSTPSGSEVHPDIRAVLFTAGQAASTRTPAACCRRRCRTSTPRRTPPGRRLLVHAIGTEDRGYLFAATEDRLHQQYRAAGDAGLGVAGRRTAGRRGGGRDLRCRAVRARPDHRTDWTSANGAATVSSRRSWRSTRPGRCWNAGDGASSAGWLLIAPRSDYSGHRSPLRCQSPESSPRGQFLLHRQLPASRVFAGSVRNACTCIANC